MTRVHRPKGPSLSAWEANILKLRAFEMVLTLHYTEDLRQFIIESIRNSDSFSGLDRLGNKDRTEKAGKTMDRARAILVEERLITKDESDELRALLDYRNLIGHQIPELTADIGPNSDLARLDPKTLRAAPPYDYTSVKRVKTLKRKIEKAMMGKFIMPLSLTGIQFQAAEQTYITEIERLKLRIRRQLAIANKTIAHTRAVIESIPGEVMNLAEPYHPRNLRGDGSLTREGSECAFRLFDANATPLAVAYMMRISLRSAKHWFKKWQTIRALV